MNYREQAEISELSEIKDHVANGEMAGAQKSPVRHYEEQQLETVQDHEVLSIGREEY